MRNEVSQLTITRTGQPLRDAELLTLGQYNFLDILASLDGVLDLVLEESHKFGEDLHSWPRWFENLPTEAKDLKNHAIAADSKGQRSRFINPVETVLKCHKALCRK